MSYQGVPAQQLSNNEGPFVCWPPVATVHFYWLQTSCAPEGACLSLFCVGRNKINLLCKGESLIWLKNLVAKKSKEWLYLIRVSQLCHNKAQKQKGKWPRAEGARHIGGLAL